MTKKYYTVKISLIIEREYADPMTKAEAKEMALEDYYDDMLHHNLPEPKVEVRLA